jgi:hypothetical protein
MAPSAQVAGGGRRTRWTRTTIIKKIREWDARHGDPPCSADWNPSLARWRAQEWRIDRYREGRWPSTNAVKRHFDGSFDAAVRAAGLVPHRPGPRREAGEASPALPQREPVGPRVDGNGNGAATTTDGLARALVEADARLRAAVDQTHAAQRDAALARREAEAAWAAVEAAEARAGRPRLTAEEAAALPRRGPAGPAVLGDALKALARARAANDRAGLVRALGDVAAAAVRWRERL